MEYSKNEKLTIVIDIIVKLQNFPTKNGSTTNFYNKDYTFYDEFKLITDKWIKTPKTSFQGKLYFGEINKYFEYYFPDTKNKEPLFVLRY